MQILESQTGWVAKICLLKQFFGHFYQVCLYLETHI